jgi:hypothetical protein
MTQNQILALILSKPEPIVLWKIRRVMLEAGLSRDDRRSAILDELYEFINKLVASSTARQYSHFASILDLGAVGGVAVQNLLEMSGSKNFTQRLVAGGLSEVLMVMAARQYVKAWEEEMKSAYDTAAWRLFEEFWHISSEMQSELSPGQRRQLVDELVNPLRDDETGGTVKATFIVHYYQLLLVAHMQSEAQKDRERRKD